MSVLETLYILFKGDTSDLKRSTDDALKTTNKLTDSIKSIDKETEKVGRNFAKFAGHLTSALAAFASIHSVVSGLRGAIDYDIALGNASMALGVNAEQLDAWDNAIRKTGGTAEGFQGSLKSLANHFHTTAKVALQSLPQLASVFHNLDRYSAFTLGKAYGLDEPTILLLQQGRREVESLLKQQKELGLVTQKDVEVSKKYNDELGNLKKSFIILYNSIILPLLPSLIEFFKVLRKGLKYITQHKDVVIGAFVGIGAAALSAGFAFGLITLEGVLLAAALVVLIGLFALLWEDTKVYFNGGKSLIGEYIDEWKRLGNIVNKILETWREKFLNFLDQFKIFKGYVSTVRGENDIFHPITKGQKFIDFASATPLNSLTSSSVFNSSIFQKEFNRNANINTGPITINTQANSAEGIAKDLSLHFKDHLDLAATANYFADNTYA